MLIFVTKMTLLEKNKICRTFRAVGHLGTLQTHYIESYQTHCRVPIVVTLYFCYTIIHSDILIILYYLLLLSFYSIIIFNLIPGDRLALSPPNS